MKNAPFINREISWLSFNDRVLQEAADESLPLLERLRFLGIYSNNKDEFFRVRVGTLRRLRDIRQKDPDSVSFDPEELLNQIGSIDLQQQKRFERINEQVLQQLTKHNVWLINEKQLTDKQGGFIREYFREHVRPDLFPIMVKNLRRTTIVQDRAVYLAVRMSGHSAHIKDNHALIKVPASAVGRFVLLPVEKGVQYVMMLDDLIRYSLPEIFSIFNYTSFEAYTIKITRDAELDIDNDLSRSFMERMSESVKQRRKGRPVRIIYDRSMPDKMLELISRQLKISLRDNLIPGGRYHNFKDYMAFPISGHKNLSYLPWPPLPHPLLTDRKSLFDVIRKKDIMLHFPYQAFHYIIDLLREASIDPKVKSIKMTIYRAAKNSKVINALINAARNGKLVTVFMELQARFDEQANIYWAEKLLEEGVKVLHATPGLKVHAKLMVIRRKEEGKLVAYANIGTGNFNEETAKVYADDSLLTARQEIANEVDKVFELIEHNLYAPVGFNHLVVSPVNTRNFFLGLINREIKNARSGLPAALFFKMNSLVDEALVEKLYQASAAGVNIRLIIRGICVLIPGMPVWSENIEAISIVDRYLEHSRVYLFHNAGEELFYISSADLMTRNLDHRIEVSCPVYDKAVQQEIRDMLEMQWNDTKKARVLDEYQQNKYRILPGHPSLRSQEATYHYFKKKVKNKSSAKQ
jgi:polyphosphate kinase